MTGPAPSPTSWPAVPMAEALRRLTAPGAPFEMRQEEVLGRPMRTYVHAVPNLRRLFDASRGYGARDLLVYQGERLSFEAHWRAATTFSHALLGLGVRKGDRVAVAMRNLPEWSICAWGALAVGAVLVPLNAWEPGAALARMIADCEAKVVVADRERAERLAPHRADLGARLLVARDNEGPDSLEAILGPPGGYGDLDPAEAPDPQLVPDDLATIFYTSGTTGRAKGAVGSHRNVATNLINTGFRNACAAVRRGDPPPRATGAERRMLLPLPFFHVTGFHSNLVPALANGLTLTLMYRWDVEGALDLIEAERINGLALVPSQAVQLVDSPSLGRRDLRSVDTVGYGGAAAAPWLAARVREVFPHAFAGQGYGATETSSLVAANSAEDMLAHPGSVGVIAPACDLRIVDDEGRDAPAGQPGELWVRGPNVVRGYWRAPEATAEAFVDGWYRTGDVGRIDPEGFVTLLDRAKDMLIRGGENIYCVEIEDALASHPAVAEAAVIGVPDPVLGELVGAVVRLKPGLSVDAQALTAHVSADLAAHKRPATIRFRDHPLPRNAAGKILKRELKAELQATPSPVESA